MNVKVFLGFLLIANAAAANLYKDGGHVYILGAELTNESKASVQGCKVTQAHWAILKFDTDHKIEVVFKDGNSAEVVHAEFADIAALQEDLKSGQFDDSCKIDITLIDTNGVDDANANVCWAKYGDEFAVQLCNNGALAEQGCTLPDGLNPTNFVGLDNEIDVLIKDGKHSLVANSAPIDGATKPAAVNDKCELAVKLIDDKRLSVV